MSTRHLSDEDRFMTYVEADPNGGCWLWSGAVAGNGYGAFKYNKRNIGAHRFSISHFKGDIGSQHVLHSCDTPLCVNPDHMRPGTRSENMVDAIRRGRKRYAGKTVQKLPSALITEAIRRVIDGEPKRAVARALAIDPASIRYALNRANQGADQ